MRFEQVQDAKSLAKYFGSFGLQPDTPVDWLVLEPGELAQLQEEGTGLLARMLAAEPRNFSEFNVAHREITNGDDRHHSFVITLNLDAPVPGRHAMEFCRANARSEFEKEFAQAFQVLCGQAVRHAHRR